MQFREWRSLVLARRLPRQRFLWVPAAAVLGAAIAYGAAWQMVIAPRMFRVEGARYWVAEWDEHAGEIRAAELDERDWLARIRQQMTQNATFPGPTKLSALSSHSLLTRSLRMHLDTFFGPFNEVAVESIRAAWTRTPLAREFPGAFAAAAASPGTPVRLERFYPVWFLWAASAYAPMGLGAAAVVALLIPDRREVAGYRLRNGLCIRCRYPTAGARVCPECGAPREAE